MWEGHECRLQYSNARTWTRLKMKQIYKNLYYDEEDQQYVFMSGGEKRLVVSQESYLMIYLLETMLKMENTKWIGPNAE